MCITRSLTRKSRMNEVPAMKKKRRTKRATYWGMAANTTSKDWGHGPVAGKGGKTRNYESNDHGKKESKGE